MSLYYDSGALAKLYVRKHFSEIVADLRYAHTPEYETGHGVSTDWELVEGS